MDRSIVIRLAFIFSFILQFRGEHLRAADGLDSLGPDAIRAAIWDDQLESLRSMLSGHPELAQVQDASGYTPLMHAAANGRTQAVELLLNSGANSTITTQSGLGAIEYAILGNHFDTADVLAKHGPAPRVHASAALGRLELLDPALKADPSLLGSQLAGMTPLSWAARAGSSKATEFILRFEAPNRRNADGSIALDWAAAFGRADCVRTLLRAMSEVNAKDLRGKTPLHHAAEHGNSEVVDALLGAGSDASIADDGGDVPLVRAAVAGNSATLVALANRPNPQESLDRALWKAVSNARPDCVALLVSCGALVTQRNNQGNSLLHLAASNGDSKSLLTLIQSGADPNVTDGDLDTPLHIAARCSNTEVVRVLLRAGAGRFKQNKNGQTPVDAARLHDNASSLRLFLDETPEPR